MTSTQQSPALVVAEKLAHDLAIRDLRRARTAHSAAAAADRAESTGRTRAALSITRRDLRRARVIYARTKPA